MKKTKRILCVLLILSLIISALTFVNADTTLVISDGIRKGNIVEFTIKLPQGGGLNGDANDNGRVDEYRDFEEVDEMPAEEDYNVDAYLIAKYVSMLVPSDDLNMLLADYNLDGRVDIADVVEMESAKEVLKNPITLDGTLAKESSIDEMSKNNDGTYKVLVMIPTDKDGTIGITIKPNVFKYSSTVANEEISSDLLTISTDYYDDYYDSNIKISDGIKDGNKVTFKIDSPKGTGLNGDANGDGKLDEADTSLINKYIMDPTSVELNKVLADYENDGEINSIDALDVTNRIIFDSDDDKTNDSIQLKGTLAENSTYQLVKDQDGSYKIVVTIPENVEEGTIGVIVDEYVLKTTDNKVNKQLVSNLFDLAKNQNNDNEEFKVIDKKDEDLGDGKVKVTITVNKELDPDKLPEGWTLGEDGKLIWKVMDEGATEEITLVAKDGSTIKYTVTVGDKTTAPGTIPQTGVRNTIIVVVAAIAIIAIVVFVRSRKMLK